MILNVSFETFCCFVFCIFVFQNFVLFERTIRQDPNLQDQKYHVNFDGEILQLIREQLGQKVQVKRLWIFLGVNADNVSNSLKFCIYLWVS